MQISFKKYIEELYLEQINEKVKLHICDNYQKIDFHLRNIDYIDNIKWHDGYIEKFYIHDLGEGNLKVSIVIESEVSVREYSKNGRFIEERVYPWVLVECRCYLTEIDFFFKITSVDIYDKVYRDNMSLTDSLIPYIKKVEMDDICKTILQKIYPEALTGAPLDPTEFSKRLGLTIEERSLRNENLLGSFFFKDFKPRGSNLSIKKNTILINKKAKQHKHIGAKNFTLMHECCHYILHKNVFLLEQLYNKNAISIKCFDDGSAQANTKDSPCEWMEWQADNLAIRLLMPKDSVIKNVECLIEKYKAKNNTNDLLPFYETLIGVIARHYRVSKEAAKIRLVELGYDFPLGCFIYVDGNKVPAHTFKSGSLLSNETYSIGEEDAAFFTFSQLYTKNNKKVLHYIYVESHLCLNHPKYIENDITGKMKLTDYARRNMHECCVKFEVDTNYKITHEEMNYKLYNILNRKKCCDAKFVIKAYTDYEKAATENNETALMEADKKVYELLSILPRTTKGLFTALRKYSGYTKKEITEGTGIGDSTFDRYFYECHSYTKNYVVRLLLFMNIHPMISNIVLTMCNCALDINDPKDQIIASAINHKWKNDFEETIQWLNKKEVFI